MAGISQERLWERWTGRDDRGRRFSGSLSRHKGGQCERYRYNTDHIISNDWPIPKLHFHLHMKMIWPWHWKCSDHLEAELFCLIKKYAQQLIKIQENSRARAEENCLTSKRRTKQVPSGDAAILFTIVRDPPIDPIIEDKGEISVYVLTKINTNGWLIEHVGQSENCLKIPLKQCKLRWDLFITTVLYLNAPSQHLIIATPQHESRGGDDHHQCWNKSQHASQDCSCHCGIFVHCLVEFFSYFSIGVNFLNWNKKGMKSSK